MNDTIYLHNLNTRALIGILPHERIRPQALIISLDIETDFSRAAADDDIAHAVNYAAVADFISAFAEESSFGLLEAFAAALCDRLFAAFPLIQALSLNIQKPGAIAATRTVGVKMRRSRQA